MSKYEPLKRHLATLPVPVWRTSFREIERILGFPLPPSSRRHRALWSNNPQNHVMTKAWLNAGWLTEQVDLEKEELVFRKTGSGGNGNPSAGSPPAAKSPFAGLKGTVRIHADFNITEPTGEEWSAERGIL
ncbi:hypothetical protein VB618_07785 [Microvirga sp. CF3062]|uniref:DUF7662 domain-containing protein n=1 Tax=Microvirga sp. CF3062 TaxID=3110182 RepID=UPI002E79D921|nr:hypothetical protein [Microvirga sp. CF3062]MEE1656093.1 hypothetical protein [Microvirga sp. CF3062]